MDAIVRRLRHWAGLHLFRVLVMPLEGLPRLKVAHPELHYAPLTRAEALAWCADPDLELTEDQVMRAYANGDVCVGVTENGQPVGYVWFAFGIAPHTDGVWIQVGPETRYSYKAFIRPSHRGRRISQELYTRAGRICPRRGRKNGLIIIYLDNRVSLRASAAAGRVPVGYAGYVKWGAWTLPFSSPGASRHGMRFFVPEAAMAPAPARLS